MPNTTRLAALAILLTSLGTAHAETCVLVPFHTELLDDARFCASSFLPGQAGNNYGPAELFFSSDREQAWCEGVGGPGAGEWASVEIRPKMPVRTILVENGYQKSAKSFAENGRARKIRIETSNGTRIETTLNNQAGSQYIRLPDWEDIGRIKLTILSVYPGSKYDDTCLSALWPNLEESRENEWQEMNRGTPFKAPK